MGLENIFPSGATCLALGGGSLSSTGANVLAWFSKAQRDGREFTSRQVALFYVACFFMNMTGILMFAASCALGGAVATVMPIQTGSNLLTNMFWQITLGIKHFDKAMRLGTILLVISVAQLGQVGPDEPAKLEVLKLLQQPQAIAWIAFLVIGSGVTCVTSVLLLKQPVASFSKLVSMTSAVSLTTVLGASIGKCFGVLQGFDLYLSVAAYMVDGLLCLGFTLVATANCDVSIFIPAQLSSQLILNMITGYLVWGDSQYIDNQFVYICCYLSCIVAVYLISPEMDSLADLLRHRRIRQTRLSMNVSPTPLGGAIWRLSDLWEQLKTDATSPSSVESDPNREELEIAMRQALEIGLESGAITRPEIIALSMRLLSENGFAPTAAVISWIEECEHFKKYSKHDPDFAVKLRGTLPPGESQKLALLGSAVSLCEHFT